MDRAEFINRLEKYTREEDLSDFTVTGEIIRDMDFSPFYLGHTWFVENQFDSCTFHTTDLSAENFGGNIFHNCAFSENRIIKSDWNDVKMLHCTLVSVEAVRAYFLNLIMEDCEVKDSEFIVCFFEPLHREVQEDGHFSRTVFRNCKFDGGGFEECVFEDVEFIGCTFTDTKIDTANPGAKFTDCTFRTRKPK